jgi:hypothetical protein
MSKKLIAVASAAALALSALVAAPAYAYSHTVNVVDVSATSTGSASNPYVHNLPETNDLSEDFYYVDLQVDTTSVTATDVTLTASGGVRLLEEVIDAAGDAIAVGVGSTSLTVKASRTTSKTVYAYTTSTTAGKIVIKTPDKEETIYVASLEGAAYNVASATFPTLFSGGSGDVTVALTDVFGNAITSKNPNAATEDVFRKADADATTGTYLIGLQDNLELKTLGATALTGSDADWYYQAATKTWRFADRTDLSKKSISVDSSYSGPVSMSVILTVASLADVGLPAPKTSAFSNTNATDLSAQVTALTAQVAALTAQLDASRPKAKSVTKKKYNTLARKWNRAFPSQKVALKK